MSETLTQKSSLSSCLLDDEITKAIADLVTSTITTADNDLRHLNHEIHSNPELAFEEVFAHNTLCTFLERRGFHVTRSAYGIPTAFEAEYPNPDNINHDSNHDNHKDNGRIVVVCAEYDALPEIGHACGHNLIAISSVATFLAVASVLDKLSRDAGDGRFRGRVRILGTPAEESGGGKIKLIDAGAFSDPNIALAIMSHPVSGYQVFRPEHVHDFGQPDREQKNGKVVNGDNAMDGVREEDRNKGRETYLGVAGFATKAYNAFRTTFHGRTAHASVDAWKGLNALDAAVAAYNNVALLRQQIEPHERVNCIIEDGGRVANVIPDYTRMSWIVRSTTKSSVDRLVKRVRGCVDSAGVATGCEVLYDPAPSYLNLRYNDTFCQAYVADMAAHFNQRIMLRQEIPISASTDMGNVSFTVPVFHGAFTVPSDRAVGVHNPKFTEVAGTDGSHKAALNCAKGMAMLAIRALVDGRFAGNARRDFETMDKE